MRVSSILKTSKTMKLTMTAQRLSTYIVTLMICLFGVSTLNADDFLGKASIGGDSSMQSTSTQKKPEPKPAPRPVAAPMPQTVKATPFHNFKSNLLRYDHDNFQKVTLEDPSIEYYAFYFSAHWCQPCRKFTPQLITAYKDLKTFIDKLPAPRPVEDADGNVNPGKPHKNFEVIFVSWDHSKSDMFDYVKATDMPWLILDYDKIETTDVVKNSHVEGIPTLLVFDKTGKLIIGSTEAYVSPNKVLDAFVELVKRQ